MTLRTAGNRKALGMALVALQFASMFLLAVLALPALTQGRIPMAFYCLAVASAVLAVWILLHNRLGNFNIQPVPKQQGVLVTTGPYRFIRHPMYTTVLIGAAALALLTAPLTGWAIWLCLAVVLWIKSLFEERWMQEQHPAYAAYMRFSKRFIPWIF